MTPSTQRLSSEFVWHVSTRSSTTGGNCVEVGWRTSSRSTNTGGNCVEVGPVGDASARVAVRDSKDRDGGVFLVGAAQWTGFTTSLKHGRFDLPS